MQPKQLDEKIKKLRERKSERRKALKKAHENLDEATQKLLDKLKDASSNGKPSTNSSKKPEPENAPVEEQEA